MSDFNTKIVIAEHKAEIDRLRAEISAMQEVKSDLYDALDQVNGFFDENDLGHLVLSTVVSNALAKARGESP